MWPRYTDDPPADWDAHCREMDYLHGMLPMCEECGHHIEDEHCYEFNDVYICEECLDKNHKKRTEDVVW